MTYSLSEDLKCLAIMGNYTKLLIDPAKPLADYNLIRTMYQWADDDEKGIPVSFNNQGYRLYERLENFYLEYHKIMRETMDFLEP
jgi:predicted N-formylglutamate amidohydrolase